MAKKSVLVIEDNLLNMKLVIQLLKIADCDPIEAFNAEDGIRLVREKMPDLIFLDIQLPGMDGLTAAGIIKEDPSIANIPIIALTAHAMYGDELKAKDAGCIDYLSKPIETKKFFSTLEKYLFEKQKAQFSEIEALSEGIARRGKSTILVVDDDPLNVKLLAAKLCASGYRTLTAYNGFEALDITETHDPDLILLDIMMPQMDGYEVIRRLKIKKETMHIPIVLITALDGEEEKAKGLAAGADDFLNKPVNTTELEIRLISLLRMKKYQEQLTERIQAEKDLLGITSQHGTVQKNESRKNVLIVEDEKVDAQIMVHLLKDLPINTKIVHTGGDAMEVLEREKVDLVLLDLMLPDLDGIEVCKKIKSNDITVSIQVVIVTTLDDLNIKIRGIEVDADDFLVKPLNRDEIKSRVTSLLRKKSLMDRLHDRANTALKAAITDNLTGVYNYAYFKHFIELEIKRSAHKKDNMALLMIDVDNFKHYNDTFGHPSGDNALRLLGSVLKENIRDVDVAARYGGEEFAVILPYSDRNTGKQVAERLLGAIQRQRIAIAGNETRFSRITISVGLSVFPENAESHEFLIRAADAALYNAKKQGKNRICCAEPLVNRSQSKKDKKELQVKC